MANVLYVCVKVKKTDGVFEERRGLQRERSEELRTSCSFIPFVERTNNT